MASAPPHSRMPSEHGEITTYQRKFFYSGIARQGGQPLLLYRSDLADDPFPEPCVQANELPSRFGFIPRKAVRDACGTSLDRCFEAVVDGVVALVHARTVNDGFQQDLSCVVDAVRFVTYMENGQGILGPPVLWIAVPLGSTTCDTARQVTQPILLLLAEHDAQDVVVHWREGVLRRLSSGPPLLAAVGSFNPTVHLRRHLTSTLNVPIASEEMQGKDAQGSLTLYFHEHRDLHGIPSDKVLAVSNCHVLMDPSTMTEDYRFEDGAEKKHVRISGERRYTQGLEEADARLSSVALDIDIVTSEIERLEAMESRSSDDERELDRSRTALARLQTDLPEIQDYEAMIKSHDWSDVKKRNIGHIVLAKPVKAIPAKEGNEVRYTEDMAVFELDKTKIEGVFKGTTVDMGTKHEPHEVTRIFYPLVNAKTAFKYPLGRMLKIRGVVGPEILRNPNQEGKHKEPCLIVGKDGTGTGLTFGRHVGIHSYSSTYTGEKTFEVAIYAMNKDSPAFAGPGDSGALIWDGNGRAVGQLHAGMAGQDGKYYVTYATPAWWLLERIREEYPHAVFWCDTYSVESEQHR